MSEDVSSYENKKENEDVDNIYETPYHAIREIWLKEFKNIELQKLDYDTIKQIRKFEKLVPKEGENEIERELNRKTLQYIKFFSEDISKLRFSKIVDAVINKKELVGLSPIEKVLYENLKDLYTVYTEKMGKFDIGQIDPDALEDIIKEPIMKRTKKLLGVSLVDLDDILDVKGIAYRGIKRGTIISMEKDNIKPIIERGFIRLIKHQEEKEETEGV